MLGSYRFPIPKNTDKYWHFSTKNTDILKIKFSLYMASSSFQPSLTTFRNKFILFSNFKSPFIWKKFTTNIQNEFINKQSFSKKSIRLCNKKHEHSKCVGNCPKKMCSMYNHSNKPYMELESNKTTWKTLKPAQTVLKTFFLGWRGGGEGKTGIFRRTPMQNRSNKPYIYGSRKQLKHQNLYRLFEENCFY